MKKITPTILLIDDDKFFLEFYRSEMAQYNFKVEFAVDGEEGLKKAKEIIPDAIILDVILPKKDGFEVLEELKKDDKTKNIPVVVASVLSEDNDIKRLLSLGAAKTFNKLSNLPREVAIYIQEAIGNSVEKIEVKPTTLKSDQINSVFKEGIKEIEDSLMKLFGKKTHLEDINATLVPFSQFKKNIEELADLEGTIFVHTNIKAKIPGISILTIKRKASLSLIRLIEKGTSGKNMDLGLDDQVIEEFANIIINAFLNKLAKSISGPVLVEPGTVDDTKSIKNILASLDLPDENMVVFLEESYHIEELDLSFSLYIVFDQKLISS